MTHGPTEASSPSEGTQGSGAQDSADSLLREVAAGSDPSNGVFAPPQRLEEGDVVADRFVIERMARRGGMGAVYRALERMTGWPVALKVMARQGRDDDERFAQEARVLAELSHPAIVRYVAHGATAEGQPFLAMEWLEGEDLSERLAHKSLSVVESLAVARRIAEGLAAAHARGVIHRDVKPSNVFLVSGDPARAKLLDFGIVRLQLSAPAATARPVTRTGNVIGTVGYMSPEQAIADWTLDVRTDIFALGCVLFECLTGQPAFSGVHVVAVLAKVLREEAPRLRQIRPELSRALDDLVARMLSKEKEGRPADGAALLRELESLASVGSGASDVPTRPSPRLSASEQRLVSLMLAAGLEDSQRAGDIVRRHGGEVVRLANGALLVMMSGRSSTSEQIVADAVCALELHRASPASRIALSISKAQLSGGPPGHVIDQAAALLAASTWSGIRVDEATAALLGERFDVAVDDAGAFLVGRRADTEPPRTLLGKATPCVGRDKELTLLDGTLRECVEESVARAVLVTGPPGQGKSRLRYEFVRKVRERGDVAVLTARADPVGAGSSFMMVRQLVRQAAGLREGDPAPEQHTRLRAYVAEVCERGDFARIADFLGELLGVPSTEKPSPELRSARNDAQIMAVWLARSFGEWLAAECSARPLLVVLEDLHWGDLPSVNYLGDALRTLAARPLMVLALGRLEVRETFPNLWAGMDVHEVPLGRLTPRAAERLARASLGEAVSAETLNRVVERADGNAFYLEELIRRVAEGGGDALPDTVLALAQSRLERLEPEARRIVRAASVFGEVFWRGGIAHLLGAPADPQDLDAWLRTLAEREVISAGPESRFSGERAFSFRHGLVREAGYAMLTEGDRTSAHGLAGEWLERVGEKDALTIAGHFERAGEQRRAVRWLLLAAQTASDGGNMEAALGLAGRGLACEPDDSQRGQLQIVQAWALWQCGNWAGSVAASREAMGLLPRGSTAWFSAASFLFHTGMFLGDVNATAPVLQALMQVPVPPEPSAAYASAVHMLCVGLRIAGQFDAAYGFVERAEASTRGASDVDPVFGLRLQVTRAWLECASGQLESAFSRLSRAREAAAEIGDTWSLVSCSTFLAWVFMSLGSPSRAEAAKRQACEHPEWAFWTDWSLFFSASAKAFTGDAGAGEGLRELLDHHDPFLIACSRAMLALALLCRRDSDAAEREALIAIERGTMFPNVLATALAVQGRIALERRQGLAALSFAEKGLGVLSTHDTLRFVPTECLLHVTHAEALHTLGRTDEARTAILEARDRIMRIASTLDAHPDLRQSFLANIVANARTLELARDWEG
jgi:eukaryotic-like serine/threonine-protein kinase